MPLTPAQQDRLDALRFRQQQLQAEPAQPATRPMIDIVKGGEPETAPPVVPDSPLPMSPLDAVRSAMRGEQRLPFEAPSAETQTFQAAHPTLEAFPHLTDSTETLASMLGETGGGVAGASLGALTSPVTGPVGPAAGALIGSTVGGTAGMALARRMQTGTFPSQGELAAEAVMTAIPQAAESLLRPVGRFFLRSTPGAQRIRFDEAARQARLLPEVAFQPMPLDRIGGMFDAVRDSGVRVGVTDTAGYLSALGAGKRTALLEEVARLDRVNKTGGRFLQLVEGIAGNAPVRVVGLDIGQAQYLSSELRKRLGQLESPEARQLLRDFRQALDDDIFSGAARGRVPAGTTPQVLEAARREYARHRAAEELSTLIESKITSSPDLSLNSFNLRALTDELRRGTSMISREVNRALDLTPGARQRFHDSLDQLSTLYRTIELPMADVAGFRRNAIIAGLGQALSALLVTETGQRMLRESVLHGRGQLSINAIAVGVNAARHELGLDARGIMPQTSPLRLAPSAAVPQR